MLFRSCQVRDSQTDWSDYCAVKLFSYDVRLSVVLLAQGEHELTGNEDPSVLNAYISYLPSRLAFKEGMLHKT